MENVITACIYILYLYMYLYIDTLHHILSYPIIYYYICRVYIYNIVASYFAIEAMLLYSYRY